MQENKSKTMLRLKQFRKAGYELAPNERRLMTMIINNFKLQKKISGAFSVADYFF